MKTQSEVAAKLEAARVRQSLKYTDLATATGLSVLAVRQALQGHTAMRVPTMMALADALGLEMVLLPKMVAKSITAEEAGEEIAPVLTSVARALQTVRTVANLREPSWPQLIADRLARTEKRRKRETK